MKAPDVLMSSKQFHKILQSLKKTAHNTQLIDQILSQAITTGFAHPTPTWNCIVRAYSNSPTPIKAIFLYNHYMKGNSIIRPDNYTYPALIKACSRMLSLAKGEQVHAHVIKIGLDYDVFVQNALIHFYGSMSRLTHARLLFDTMPQRDIASWNTILGVCNVDSDSWIEVFVLFKNLINEGVRADGITLVIVLSACAQVGGMEFGSAIHAYAIKGGLRDILNLDNALLGVYAKCREMDSALRLFNEMVYHRDIVSHTILINGYVEMGLVDLARDVFDQIVNKDLVLWNSMMHAYVKAKRSKEALQLFERMDNEGLIPDGNTMVSILAACASLSDLQYGRLVHRLIFQNNIRQDDFVGTALIDMYSKCGSLEDALVTFYKMDYKDVYTWTAMIEGLANYGHGNEALCMFYQMEKEGIKPNEATFVSALTACSHSGLVNEGCQLFNRMVGYKIQPRIEHFGCLIDLLSRAGLLHQAEEFIKIMLPDKRLIAYKTLLSACTNYSEFDLGEKVANEMVKLDSKSHATHILISNFYAVAGRWVEVAKTRRIVREFNMKKEAGVSSLELKT